MGDHYSPSYGGQSRYDEYRDDRYDRNDAYDRNGGYDRYRDNSYRSRDTYYGDREPRRNYYDREPYPRSDNGFTFRGAAERYSPQDAHPQHAFDFRAPGPPGPRFPPAEQSGRSKPGSGGQRRKDRGRGGRGGSGNRERGRFASKAAHNRDILKNYGREPTPEQLEGMNLDGQERFKDVDSSSEAETADVAEDHTEDGPAPAKRMKVEAAAEDAAPKWTNPDPYTALPPPETLGAPKKDIVRVIRRARNDATTMTDSSSAVKNNADFIALNFDSDVANGDASDDSDASDESDASDDSDESIVELPPPDAPKGPSGHSHHETLQGASKEPVAEVAPSSAAARTLPSSNTINFVLPVSTNDGPPKPPAGFVMPTDEEIREQLTNTGKTGAKKRKRNDAAEAVDADIVDEWLPVGPNTTPCVRLHKEICDFYEFVKPYDYEAAVRNDLIARVQRALRTCAAPGAATAQIKCFGSFAAGLYLPTADMDLVALSQEFTKSGRKIFAQNRNHMSKVATGMENAGVARRRGVTVVARAKVPIIKFTDVRTGIHVDISFENDTGTTAITTFQNWKAQYPAMPVIVVLIKQLLAMRGLNEVYLGGLGGFSIICLVVSMMQLMPELQTGNMDPQSHYGNLLLTFLDLYGNKFDVVKTGIKLNPPGYFDKEVEPLPGNARRLTIIDPNNPNNDISGGTARINDVFDVFRKAHSRIQQRLHKIRVREDVQSGILGCVLGGNYTSFMRQRDHLSLLHRDLPMTPPLPSAFGSRGAEDQTKKQAGRGPRRKPAGYHPGGIHRQARPAPYTAIQQHDRLSNTMPANRRVLPPKVPNTPSLRVYAQQLEDKYAETEVDVEAMTVEEIQQRWDL
ncbi:Cid1 family poly A polymerase [Teratosphaeria destructans]|uniref:polynucleotide adenylyltransferase n=1 Tax=Teratosphaeria destructans TaxID=418781 RepID=A0A9W7T065_9PEZI|nr:Cid1 family poly A polymerase [Teratosphaeria destructans]